MSYIKLDTTDPRSQIKSGFTDEETRYIVQFAARVSNGTRYTVYDRKTHNSIGKYVSHQLADSECAKLNQSAGEYVSHFAPRQRATPKYKDTGYIGDAAPKPKPTSSASKAPLQSTSGDATPNPNPTSGAPKAQPIVAQGIALGKSDKTIRGAEGAAPTTNEVKP
jgi:hypothetical protein